VEATPAPPRITPRSPRQRAAPSGSPPPRRWRCEPLSHGPPRSPRPAFRLCPSQHPALPAPAPAAAHGLRRTGRLPAATPLHAGLLLFTGPPVPPSFSDPLLHQRPPACPARHSTTLPSGGEQVFLGSFAASVVLPASACTSHLRAVLVVLHRQPPVARLVSLARTGGPMPRRPGPAAGPRHDSAGNPPGPQRTPPRPAARLAAPAHPACARRPESTPTRCAPPRLPALSRLRNAPSAAFGHPHHSPRPRARPTAVRLAGANRAANFLVAVPVEFAATVDQWSAL
jgi:hypothetical protein